MLVTQVAVFLQRLVNDVFEPLGHIVIQAHGGHGRTIHDRFKMTRGTFSMEGHVPVAIS